MTLIEKFIAGAELYHPIDKNFIYTKELLRDIEHRRDCFIDGCKYQSEQQDEFAIEFAEWCEMKMVFSSSVIHKPTYDKLLLQFKKEKGL
jgi:hypothetical protein